MFTRVSKLALSAALFSLLISVPAANAQEGDPEAAEDKKALSIEEMRNHRRTLRDDLMVPSLKGIRGIAFGVPGDTPDEAELEKVVENRLKQLPILIKRFQDLEPGVTKPVDAFLQVKVLAAGKRFALVELTLTQWSTLARDPSVTARTITYTDQAVTNTGLVKETATHLINQFVIDYLKANVDVKKDAPQTSSSTEEEKPVGKKKKKKS